MVEVASAELREKIENPIKFQWGTGGADQPPATIHGYDVSVFIARRRKLAWDKALPGTGEKKSETS